MSRDLRNKAELPNIYNGRQQQKKALLDFNSGAWP